MTQKVKPTGVVLDLTIKHDSDEKYSIVDELIRGCVSNAAFYDTDKTLIGSKMHAIFNKAAEFLKKLLPVTKSIEDFAGIYDFDEETPGNGYRSFVHIFNSAVIHTEKICKYVTVNRGNLLFRKSAYLK